MKLFTRPRTPEAATAPAASDEAEPDHDGPSAEPRPRKWWQRPPADEQLIWPDSNRWGTRLFLGVLVVAVLCGPLGLLIQLSRSHPSPTTSVGSATSTGHAAEQLEMGQRAAAAAAGFVEVWLTSSTADTATVTALLTHPPKDLDLPETATGHASAYPVQTSAVGQHRWNVIVRSQTDTTVAWWLVDVIVVDHTARVVTVPGQIPPPAVPAALDVDDIHQLNADHPAAETAAAFLNAMLSGADTTRWTSPDSALAPLPSPACTEPATDVATPVVDPPQRPDTGATLLVLATTHCSSTTYQYGLDLRGRDGRWEVAGLTTPSHVLGARPQPDQDPSPDSTPSGEPSAHSVPPTPSGATPSNTDR